GKTEHIQVLLQAGANRRIPVGFDTAAEQVDSLGSLSPRRQDLCLDFERGPESDRQMWLAVQGTFSQQLARQRFRLFGVGVSAVQLVRGKTRPRHPGESFDVVRGYALAATIALQFGLGSGNIVPRERFAYIIRNSGRGNCAEG